MEIRILSKSDAQVYQEVRLSALKNNPEAFGSTYEREVNVSLQTVAERIEATTDKFVLGAFHNNGSLVGIVTFVREDSPKTSHKGNVFGMYVAPEGRGRGGGACQLQPCHHHDRQGYRRPYPGGMEGKVWSK